MCCSEAGEPACPANCLEGCHTQCPHCAFAACVYSSTTCYCHHGYRCLADIQAGQGLYYDTLTKSWRARNCVDNYGVTNKTYGLTPAPCKACPTNMITSTDATAYSISAAYYTRNADNTGGFTSVMACVVTAGEHLLLLLHGSGPSHEHPVKEPNVAHGVITS